MDVSIIIVNYNTKKLLLDCISSIYGYTSNLSFEIIVVDNASIDQSEELICSRFPSVRWFNSAENLGFGRANNLGAKYANGEYLFFLNSDTLLLNNAILQLLSYMKMHNSDNVGVLGTWLLDGNREPNNSFGFFPSIKNEIAYLLGKYHRPDNSELRRERDADFVTGADLFIAKRVFDDLGGFDSEIFMYYEETDLQYRLSESGLIRRIIPGPEIIHLEGGSFNSKKLTVSRFIMAQTSYNYYLRKHFKGPYYYLYYVILCFIRLTIFVTTDWSLKDKIKAYKVVLRK